MEILKVVLTGGPCGGKTTSLAAIEENFKEKGYHVIVVPEAATILINSGIKPFGANKMSMYNFQKYVMKLQLELENLASKAATETTTPTIIVCDRGLLDDKAYVTEIEFQKLLADFNATQFDLLNRYDLVIHLKTVADGKEEFYTTTNNEARTETPEEARQKDKRTLEAWLGHENLKIIGNDVDFETKIANSIKEVHQLLKTPYPIQHQEKYLVESLDIEKLLATSPVRINITQYIRQIDQGEVIYRQSTKDNETKYTKITKIDTKENNERIVKKQNITEDEFYNSIPAKELPLRKVRYCFAYQNQYFRVDIFEDGLKLLEIEDTNKTRKRKIPQYINVTDDVTNSPEYRNSFLYQTKNQSTKTSQKSINKKRS